MRRWCGGAVVQVAQAVACGVALRMGGAPVTRLDFGSCKQFLDIHVQLLRQMFPALRCARALPSSVSPPGAAPTRCGILHHAGHISGKGKAVRQKYQM